MFTLIIVALNKGYIPATYSLVGYFVPTLGLPIPYMIWFLWYEKKAHSLHCAITKADFEIGYKVLNNSIGRRENSLLLSGSIFVTASTFLVGQAGVAQSVTDKNYLVWASWLIYGIWLMLFQLSTYGITEVTYRRLRDIEERMGVYIHRYLKKWRNPWRKWIWLWLFDGLLLVGFLLLDYPIWVLIPSFFFQGVLMTLGHFLDIRRDNEKARYATLD
jgi:hypothetical protein